MKLRVASFCLLSVLLLCFTANAGDTKPRNDKKKPANPWVSHQMNQPKPASDRRNRVSEKRVKEIRQLYERAKKEKEAKTGKGKCK